MGTDIDEDRQVAERVAGSLSTTLEQLRYYKERWSIMREKL
jgi:hypothetical protein